MPVMEIGRAPEETVVPGGSAARTPSIGAISSGSITGPGPRSHGWRPLAGNALLERLRITGRPRPAVDPELAARIRDTMEQGLATGVADGSAAGRLPVVVVTKDRLTRVLACEQHQGVSEFGDREPTAALACGALMDVLFRQLVTVGTIGEPMADGLAALRLDDRQRELATWIDRMDAAQRDELRVEVERQVDGLRNRWPELSPAWLPRTQETMRVGLARGAVELAARVDLALGGPSVDEASVALIEIKAGVRRVEHRAELHFYALVETLRSLTPPFVVATYYTRTGELDTDPVTAELLAGAARRTLAGAESLLGLAEGREPRRTPNGLCGRCAALPDCDVGRARVERVSADEGHRAEGFDAGVGGSDGAGPR
ncbi:MAG: hypothetical protein ACRDYE_00345 [Acidimicrobiales bacterium]